MARHELTRLGTGRHDQGMHQFAYGMPMTMLMVAWLISETGDRVLMIIRWMRGEDE